MKLRSKSARTRTLEKDPGWVWGGLVAWMLPPGGEEGSSAPTSCSSRCAGGKGTILRKCRFVDLGTLKNVCFTTTKCFCGNGHYMGEFAMEFLDYFEFDSYDLVDRLPEKHEPGHGPCKI